jgi:pilus assembly protein CpaC
MSFACPLLVPCICWGEGPSRITLDSTVPQRISLTVGKSTIVGSPEPIRRVSLAEPAIADAIVLTPRQIYVSGKAIGITNLTLWDEDNRVTAILDLEVSPDVSRLKEMLHKMLPDEKDISVIANNDHISLSGSVSSTANLSKVLAIAEPYAPFGEGKKAQIINLLTVAGVQQVMLEVRVAEMTRTLLRRLGINFNYVADGGVNFGLSLLNSLTTVSSSPSFSGLPVAVGNQINSVFRFTGLGATWTTFIDALQEEGLLKVLAEPTLITLSGKGANFLAGGEFPVPVPQAGIAGTPIVTIQYKPYGVGLNFTPTVLSNNKINMEVAPEVSDLDYTNAIQIAGFVVPALTTRRVSTVVEMADGQSFAIAGLLRDNIRTTIDKFPLLGDIPILGALFRSTSYQKSETELIIIVTAHLAKPVDMTKQTLSTDQYIDPDDFEFYLLGTLEGRERKGPPRSASQSMTPQGTLGLEGNFGHVIPK